MASLAENEIYHFHQVILKKNKPRDSTQFFVTKIINIQENLKANPTQYIIDEDHRNPPSFTQFKELSEHDTIKLIDQSPSKSCELDPIPTAILKEVLPAIGPLFTSVINESLQTGVFPQDVKEALVKPLLKKANLELIDKNYRPVFQPRIYGKDHWAGSDLSAYPAHI